MGATEGVRTLVREHRLRPIAILVTHGHIDHMWSVLPVADGYGIPAVIHGNDRLLLSDPGAGISRETAAALPSMLAPGERFAEPSEVVEAVDGLHLDIGGLQIDIHHAPGHTPGSVMFEIVGDVIFTGDVLFAGAIGRTDLPGGSAEDMARSLRDRVLPLSDELRLMPGHGPASTMKQERANNPYLTRLASGLSLL
jgi:glyoxylase-like metal-dependent hydrolase (beta-lactamase superfamily II)